MHPIVIGHRGASGYRPEHTRAAYNLAIALGADAIEPDIVATRDGVLIVRHENEISGTTDVATRPEFAVRRTQKIVDGVVQHGWFTEDFTWRELSTLGTRERLPGTRPANSTFDDQQPILRLRDVLDLIDAAAATVPRPLGVVAEIKHASYFASIGLPLHDLFAAEIKAAGWNDERLTMESFEPTVLAQLQQLGLSGKRVFLLEASGHPFDQLSLRGVAARSYADYLTPAGLAELTDAVDGISVHKSLILQADAADRIVGASDLVPCAHAAGLAIFCWTLRPENRFLAKTFRLGTRTASWGDWQAEFRIILGSGIDGVFADHPDLAVHVRDGLDTSDLSDRPTR